MGWLHPVEYNGVTMRSMVEVAWAKFFDSHDLVWEYEPVKFGCKRYYTPDFSLCDRTIFVEVKGQGRTPNPGLHLCPYPLIYVQGTPDDIQWIWVNSSDGLRQEDIHDWASAFGAASATPTEIHWSETEARRWRHFRSGLVAAIRQSEGGLPQPIFMRNLK